ncbi:MAG: extracellular solute-binding protein, partial [Clostridia bacterium]|nr:extracellular solute-binding protein [Clostridia bacterium]
YKIATRFIQNWGNGATSYRRIEIDGKVPFNEFLTYPFKHSTKWHAEPLADKSGSPYLVYLEKGEHTISFTAVTSEEISNATTLISAVQEDLGVLYRKIIMITGTVPDPNYVYELDESIPELLSEFDRMIKSLEESRKLISEFQSGSANDNNIKMIIQQLTEMKNKPDGIAQKLDMFTDAMNTLSNLSSTMVESPLAFDSIEFLPPDAEVSSKESSFFARLAVMVRTFLNSFNKDYTVATTQHENTINVWVSRGSEWAELMKELIRSDFEPQNNCAVKLNVLPSGSINGASTNPLLMAIASGRAPDVVINVDCTLPVEYGIRGVALDLSEFSGYKELTENYVPGIMNAFTFLDKVYGVPETMTFQSLIYRKDIFTELGLSVPNTWDEVYYQLLPVLYQNNLQMSAVGFDTLLYQNNGKYYTEDGLKVTLDIAVAHNAFEMYINQFHDLGFPIVANFVNRFRTGEMPIGFADYGTYLQMLTGAPELTGKWELAPMPGVRQEDGSIRRTTTSLCIASNVILSATKKPDLSFEFIKWWASTDIQVRYGLRLESRLGKGARWNPANINAYNDLPWNQSDLEVIYKAWNEAVAVPYVLGGIITGREVGNATNNALFNNVTPRKSLEKANKNINDELIRKQKMYNIETGDNNE